MNPMLNSFGEWLQHSSLAYVMDNSSVLAVTVSIAHYLSFFLLVGTSVMVDLRILGFAGRNQGVSQFARQFLPWTWAGLCVAVVTGFLEFTPDALTFFRINWFYAKLSVVLGGALLLLVIHTNARKWDDPAGVPLVAKLIAGISLLLWIAAILSATEVPQQANI
jgi:uncharacterized protein DUF6644